MEMNMKKILGLACAVACAAVTSLPAQQGQPQAQGQGWNGTISCSTCAADSKTATDRVCIFDCIKALGKYVFIDDATKQVMPIANQDFAGFPLYAGRRLRISGELSNGVVMVTKIEPIPSHLHIGHVMTSWRDTPQTVGLLTVAVNDGRVAAEHARLAANSSSDLAQMKLHAGHVLHALDPSIETTGPGSGYGVKKGANGALQHVGFAAKADGASANVTTHATHVSASLTDVMQWSDQAIATAQKLRAATTAAEAAPLATELAAIAAKISTGLDANGDGQIGWQAGEGGLQQALNHMGLMMKGEGL
jgi:uncharacterized protein YdeI (BOF family)